MTEDLRIGHGYDAHRFEDTPSGRPLVLGGVCVPHERSLLAHSDGDVLIHALCDALLGALGEGDIGRHFPDTDASLRNIDSTRLLAQVMTLVRDGGWQVVNGDLTVLAQAPRLSPFVAAMREKLAALLGVSVGRLNIKATTTEGMGFVGRKEGIAGHAVVLLGRAPG